MGEYSHISHTFLPVYDENSELLILGSFPSVKSREQGFYYVHPQNRFWKVPADIAGILPKTKITRIFANGKTAGNLYKKFSEERKRYVGGESSNRNN